MFLVYMSIYLERHPGRAVELLKYMDMVRGAARNNGGYGGTMMSNFVSGRHEDQADHGRGIDGELWLLLIAGGGPRSSSFRPFQGSNMQRP